MAIAQKITEFAVLSVAAADDVLPIVDDPTGGAATKKITTSGINRNFIRTPAEIAAGVTPVNLLIEPGNVLRYGAVGDGVADDRSAIQAAIDVFKGAVGSWTTNIVLAGVVTFPEGDYAISGPISTFSGIKLLGSGPTAKIIERAGFVGTELIQLTGIANRCDAFEVGHLRCTGTTVGVAAIRPDSTSTALINFWIHDIMLDINLGLMLAGDGVGGGGNQSATIERIWSFGAIDQILHINGNRNYIYDIDKETGTGTTTDPYILVSGFDVGSKSEHVLLKNILIEGIGNAGKTLIKLIDCDGCEIDNFWTETTTSDFALRLEDCNNILLKGRIGALTTTLRRLKIDTSFNVTMERFDANAEDVWWQDMLVIDAVSTFHVNDLHSRRSQSAFSITNPNISVDRAHDRQMVIDAPTGMITVSKQQNIAGQNLLVNPSFESGRADWSFSAIPPDTLEEYITSGVAPGLMAHFQWATGVRNLFQTVIVDAAWVGQTMTFSAIVKMTGTGFMVPFISGAGLSEFTTFQLVRADGAFSIITQTFTIINSASNLVAGVRFSVGAGTDEFFVDACCLSFGSECVLGLPSLVGPTEILTATKTIRADEIGKTFYLNAAGGFTSTLPAPAAGLKYKFIVKTAPTTAYIITTNAGANILFGTFLDIIGELTSFSAQDTLNFVASVSVVGDFLEVESDGTNWYCTAKSGADGGITVSVT